MTSLWSIPALRVPTLALAALCCTVTADGMERPPWVGFYVNPGKQVIDSAKFPFIKGLACRFKWSELEPAPGRFDWSAVDEAAKNAAGGGYYWYFVLWAGPHSPSWIYHEGGVPKVACTGKKDGNEYPYYLDKNYETRFHQLIDKLAEHIAGYPEKQRNSLGFVQPAFGSTGDRQLYKGTPTDARFAISPQQYLEFCKAGTEAYYRSFSRPGLTNVKFLFNLDGEVDEAAEDQGRSKGKKGGGDAKLGETLFAKWFLEHHKLDLRKQQFTVSVGYQVNGEIDQDAKQRSSFFGLDGKEPDLVRGEFSHWAQNPMFQENPVWSYYWTALSTVDRGLDMWEVTYKEVVDGKHNEAFAFANRYAYYKDPLTSPHAFVALRDVLDFTDTRRFPENTFGPVQDPSDRIRKIESAFSRYGAKVGDLAAAGTLSGVTYLENSHAMNDVGFGLIARNYERFIEQIDAQETSVGHWRIGPADQPYGRYARGFESATGRNHLYFHVDDRYFGSRMTDHPASITIKLIYLDVGTGTFSLRYDGTSNPDKEAMSITKTDTGRWVSRTVTIEDALFHGRGEHGCDLQLANTDQEDDVFHLIEITKNP